VSDFTRDQNFDRAQALYDAQEEPRIEIEAKECAHCDADADGYVCTEGCDGPLCSACAEECVCNVRPAPRVSLWKQAGYESYTAWLKGEFAKQDEARARAETMKALFAALAPRKEDFR
jgi:hypothetical protein